MKNKSSGDVPLDGWSLHDKNNHAMDLSGHGSIPASESMKIVSNGSALSLNNDGGTIKLLGPNNEVVDTFSYPDSSPGVVIQTGH